MNRTLSRVLFCVVALAAVAAAFLFAGPASGALIVAPLLALIPVLLATKRKRAPSPRWAWATGGFAVILLLVTGLTRAPLVLIPVAAVAGSVFLVVRYITHILAPAEPMAADVILALTTAGVQLAADPAPGWWTGVTPAGVVVLVRSVASPPGGIASWTGLSSLTTSALAAREGLSAQGLTAVLLVVVTGATGLRQVSGPLTLISIDQIPAYLRQAKPGRVDPVAMAAAAGISLSRETARRLASKGSSSSGRVQHQGRVTPKKPRG